MVPERWQSRSALRHLASAGPLCIFVVQAARLVAGRPMLDVSVEFAPLLQIVRLATRGGPRTISRSSLLALAALRGRAPFGRGAHLWALLLGFLVGRARALVLSHLRREVEGNYARRARSHGSAGRCAGAS